MGNNSLEQGLAAAYRLLARRARTEKQIREALAGRHFRPETIERVVAELKSKGYINDRQFTRDYLDSRLRKKPYGPLWLQASLLRLGVEREIVEEELQEFFTTEKETELAQLFYKQIQPALEGRGENNREKVVRRLLARGFSLSVVQKILEKYNDLK